MKSNHQIKVEAQIKNFEDLKRKLSPENQKIVENAFEFEILVGLVLLKIGINEKDDPIYYERMRDLFEKHAKEHFVITALENLDEHQKKHLQQYLEGAHKVNALRLSEDVIIEFINLYPALSEIVYSSMDKYIESFVGKYEFIKSVG